MRLATMLRDIWRAFFRKPATERYPAEERVPSARYRGQLRWEPERCTGCCLCVKDCPANAIEIIKLEKDHVVMRYHPDRCVFCGQCVQNCRFNCITLDNAAWELPTGDPMTFTMHFGEEADVKRLLENTPSDAADPE